MVELLGNIIQHMVYVGLIPYIIYGHDKSILFCLKFYMDTHIIIHMLILTLNSLRRLKGLRFGGKYSRLPPRIIIQTPR